MFAQNMLSSDVYGYTVFKVFDLTAYPPGLSRLRANGSHQADGAVARICAAPLGRIGKLITLSSGFFLPFFTIIDYSTGFIFEFRKWVKDKTDTNYGQVISQVLKVW